MASPSQETLQWLTVTEETLFLHDGLLRVTDLVELPKDLNSVGEIEVVAFESKKPEDLRQLLYSICGSQNNAYNRLLEYRLNALKGLWTAQNCHRLYSQEDQSEKDPAQEEALSLLKKQGLLKEGEQAPFSTRISLLLILPLLQSQSKSDPNLCGVTAQVLLSCLRDCAPLSLSKEPSDCLKGLESLLCNWLEKDSPPHPQKAGEQGKHNQQNTACALVTLACARGHLKTFIHTVHLLHRRSDLPSLPVGDVLSKLLDTEGGPGQPTCVSGGKHIVSWGFEDHLALPGGEAGKETSDKDKESDLGRSIACDGKFLYCTNSIGRGLAKIGTGLHGTLRGYVYKKNLDIGLGRVAWCKGHLLFRPLIFDLEAEAGLAHIVSPSTLQVLKTVGKPEDMSIRGPCTTVAFCSDGLSLYWVWCSVALGDKTAKAIPIMKDAFDLLVEGEEVSVQNRQQQVVLQKKDESGPKGLNESLLSRLRPFRGSASTLVALTGAESVTVRKDDAQTAGSTSCGMVLKSLVKTPMYCDGNSLVMLTPIPGAANSSARSLFGPGGGISNTRSLCSNMCFNALTGLFSSRIDLVDVPQCSLARGISILGLGICYDAANNFIWLASSDYIDQFHNPGHQSQHHIHQRLGIAPSRLDINADNHVVLSQVTRALLQHVGSMCLHQIQGELLHTALGAFSLQQRPADLQLLQRLCDILAQGIALHDNHTITCCFVVLQQIFRTSQFKIDSEEKDELMVKTREIVWKVLHASSRSGRAVETECGAMQKEGCRVLSVGFLALYPSPKDRHHLLSELLSQGDNTTYVELRDLILIEFAEQLQKYTNGFEEAGHLRLSEDLLLFVLKFAVKESCSLLKKVSSLGLEKFQAWIADVPCASPCVRYLMALQSHFLRHAILLSEPAKTSAGTSPITSSNSDKLKVLQGKILHLCTEIIRGSSEVVEVFLEVCDGVLTAHADGDLEMYLQALERVVKGTILGHLLPLLLTALTHPNLQNLGLANALLPPLMQLILHASQAAMLMKSQEQRGAESADLGADADVIDMLGEPLSVDKLELREEEEQGFLSGLRIPTPWATGKLVETIHPVRDNYKFKETVHIPGARCLYLRFDPRCSSQYDYDKLIVYAGTNTNAKKVAEYGGNTFGFGSRSVLGAGWPKDLVKVEGDSVTFSFEMRSGREHNTPDKAMWGFAVTVLAQESAEDIGGGLPFLADLTLGLSVVAYTMLSLLYDGLPCSKEELLCQHLLKSRLLQRCVWRSGSHSNLQPSDVAALLETSLSGESLNGDCLTDSEGNGYPGSTSSIPRIPLPSDILTNLRRLSQRQPPWIRQSIRDAVKPEELEEKIMSAVVKHLCMTELVQHLGDTSRQQSPEFQLLVSVMEEVYQRLDALLRQLQNLADLEQRWMAEIKDHQDGTNVSPPFFHDYHLHELKHKELSMLCFLKDVPLDPNDGETSVRLLLEKLEADKDSVVLSKAAPMSRTKQIVHGIQLSLDLLLHVDIAPSDWHSSSNMTRTVSDYVDSFRKAQDVSARSDTEVTKSSATLSRSMSAPSGDDDSIMEIIRHQRRRQLGKKGPFCILQDFVEEGSTSKLPHVSLIDQLFSFIGSDPEKSVSCDQFLKAAEQRWRRGLFRLRALTLMKDLLQAASRVGGATHLVATVTSVLRNGSRSDELTCGGMVHFVREAFAETMASVVQLAARYPIACANSIGLLCTVPYARMEEKCLVRSGLVHLLDKLCSLANHRGDGHHADKQSTRQRVSALAWAGFQVLASRCVSWENEDSTQFEELEHSGLARQVSVLLTHHLARATEGNGNAAVDTEALQEVLSLLNNLSRSQMGRTILSQPACVSKLLSLLLDQRPSPKLVLIILQLCRVALPLMSLVECEAVELPAWGQHLSAAHWSSAQPISDPPARIAALLLAKLGDLLTPGDQVMLSSRTPSEEAVTPTQSAGGSDKDKMEESDVQGGRISVFIHKRDDQMPHDIIQPLLSSENRPFRLAGGSNMDKIIRMERDLVKSGKCEVITEDAVSALRKASKWSQMGFVVSTSPPVDNTLTDNSSDKKKTTVDVICKDKNVELSRTDPVRSFVSGQVANTMAAEVVDLLHNLLTSRTSSTAQTWANAVQRVVENALAGLPLLFASLDSLASPRVTAGQLQLMSVAKLANAALCALGGFQETIKTGCLVQVVGDGACHTQGAVQCVTEHSDMVTIKLDPEPEDCTSPRYNDTIEVPLSRVMPVRNKVFCAPKFAMTKTIFQVLKSVILPGEQSSSPLQQTLHTPGDGNSLTSQAVRVVAEIQTRTTFILSKYLEGVQFAKDFIDQFGDSINLFKSLAKDCKTGEREAVMEMHCERLRMLYRDCAKPPPPPSKTDLRPSKEMVWDPCRTFPPVRASVFSQGLTVVTFLGDPSAGIGLPRGTFIYANQPIPSQAPSFYWELEILSYGENQDESGPVVSFGFAPAAEKKDGAWTNPVGTCLFLNNGKAVHYNGSSLLQWRSVRLDITMRVGDIAGIGWEQTSEPPAQGSSPRGQVYFTHRGRRLTPTLDNVAGAMYPVVHIQKKNCRVRANFGAYPFAFAEGQQHRDAAEAANDLTREIRESFGHLPFHLFSDSDSDNTDAPSTSGTSSESQVAKTPPRHPCKIAAIPEPIKEYNTDACLQYRLTSSLEELAGWGSAGGVPAAAGGEEESEEEGSMEEVPSEDHYTLLVKAWEQRVFPIIRRRFRNEAERKDGLEQIRGALQLGMTDIARQTVEFLYEENGGIPRDLHLPTIEDIREDLAKFSIERVKKGMTVVICAQQTPSTNATTMPKFAVRGMLKTFNLTGVVLDVDTQHELVQVETYLQSEGVLVRYWYPLSVLERPPQGLRKSSITGGQTLDTSNIYIHRELLSRESTLARMYLRKAFLQLLDHCNSPAMSLSLGAGGGMAACAATLQELDIENLQLLSDGLLAAPHASGTLLLSQAPSDGPGVFPSSLTQVVYSNPDRLKRELAVAIARASQQGEDYLIELTNQICLCLQNAPEMFPCEVVPVTESKVNTDVVFPGAACLVISCVADPKASKKEISPYKSPWARIATYTGKKIKKTGQPMKQEVVSYPRDVTSNSNSSEQYSPAIVPTDTIHLRVGVSPPPGLTLTINGFSSQFWMAMAYIETLVTEDFGCGVRSCGSEFGRNPDPSSALLRPASSQPSLWSLDNIVVTAPVLAHLVEIFCNFLCRVELPALIKEYLFHLFAQCLRLLHYCEGGTGASLSRLSPRLSPTQGIFQCLPQELRKLYEHETRAVPGPSSSTSGQGSQPRRLSTYLQALFEANLATFEIFSLSMTSLMKEPTTPTGAEAPPAVAHAPLKRKKLKSKRERAEVASARPQPGPSSSESEVFSTPTNVVSSTSMAGSSSSDQGASTPAQANSSTSSIVISVSSSPSVAANLEDMLWFTRAATISNILRYLGFEEMGGASQVSEAIADACNLLSTPTVAARLLVISGIPKELDAALTQEAIWKVCNSLGPLDRSSVFLPPHVTPSAPPPEREKVEKGEKEKEKGKEKMAAAGTQGKVPSGEQKVYRNKGYAVVCLPTRGKVEAVRKALYKCRALLEGYVGIDSETLDVSELPEEVLNISTVSPALLADSAGNVALEDYLMNLLFRDPLTFDMKVKATQALTEIFYSCFFVEQQKAGPEAGQDSGYISLGRQQILSSAPDNMLHTFLSAVRPPKKPLPDYVNHVLRSYGICKSPDKDVIQPDAKGSLSDEKAGKGKGVKKSPRSSKEKLVLGQGEKSGMKERKPKSKESLEKVSREAKDSADATDPASRAGIKGELKVLTLDGFLQCVLDLAKQDVRAVWRGLLGCGFHFQLYRCACVDVGQSEEMARTWSAEMDAALVTFSNEFCRKMAVSLGKVHPHEIVLTEADLAREDLMCLQTAPSESIMLRFAFLQSLNQSLETWLLPLVSLGKAGVYSRSTATLLASTRSRIFYDTKVGVLNQALNATARRKADQAAPEITLDPLESIGMVGEKRSSMATVFCQAFRQLKGVNAQQLCVPLASGGDPTYAFNVRTTGEEVHGASGSFRHFLWQVAREVQSPTLGLLIAAPAPAPSVRGRLLLKPGPCSFSEQQLLEFLGQLLGCTIRADIPLGLDLLPAFWKSLIGQRLDPMLDLRACDSLTYSYIKRIEMVETEAELQALTADVFPTFVYSSLTGQDVELIKGGRGVPVSWSNRQEYVDAIKELRLRELASQHRVKSILSGLTTVLPIQLLSLFSPVDIEMRTCGLPTISIDFLKAHTMYQVGLMETDQHIQYFWQALEGLSQEELCRFIKFACNQDRIPQTCPCSSGGPDTAHVPPYPMKIAPPDGVGAPDERFIRVETCMFMVKLPQYSSLEKMTQQLKWVINCREDPLSG